MNKKINFKEIVAKILNNDLTIKRMGLLYLFLPWLLLDILLVTVTIASGNVNNSSIISILVYIFTYIIVPMFMIYLSLVSALLIKKSLKLDYFKKYAGTLFFGFLSIIFSFIGLSLLAVGISKLF